MITRVMGRATETYWKVEPHTHIVGAGNDATRYVFDAKPEIVKDIIELDPVEICQYEGRPCYSNYVYLLTCPYKRINIGDEEVDVRKEAFYADLSEWKQFVDKVISNVDYYKEEAELDYADLIGQYNEQMINEDEKLKAYCKLHHLNPVETDVDELRKIVYGNTVTVGTISTDTSSSGYNYAIPSGYTYTSPSVFKPTWTVATTNTTSGWI